MKRAFYNPYYNNDKDISLASLGHEILALDFVNRLNLLHRHIIHYVIKGTLIYQVRNKTYRIAPGESFIIYPGEQVTYYNEGGSPCEVCWIVFSGQRVYNILKSAKISHETIIIKKPKKEFVTTVMDYLEYAEKEASVSQLRLNACILSCLSCIEASDIDEISRAKQHIINAISFMECYYGTGITTSDVADELKLDRTYFYRIFKQETGKSPSRFLMELRIDKAKQLIEQNMEFKNIAASIGINDVYYFSSLFKQIEGVSPKEYKKKQNKNNACYREQKNFRRPHNS